MAKETNNLIICLIILLLKMKLSKNKKKKIVFVGMSGGVDSSVSALLLKEQGFDVVGVFIRTWHPDFIECNEEEERRDAMRVAAHLYIPFLTFDLEKEYRDGVAMYMIEEYKKGRTPNPDVMCNKEVKFGAFLKKALSMGADFVATGHYTKKVEYRDDLKNLKNSTAFALRDMGKGTHDTSNYYFFNLQKSVDPSKDQSYFLWTLKQEQLEKIIFPIGDLKKEEVRKIAKKYKLPVAEKKDSQGICFLGDIDLKDFLKHYIKEKKGNIVNEKGEIIGEHNGVIFFTLGERHGFNIIKKGNNDKPYYVVGKDVKKNILHVSQDKEINNSTNSFNLENVNWISEMPEISKKYTAQIRYHGEFLNCHFENIKEKEVEIIFEKNIQVASGQSVVFYNKDICLGGGVVV
jgi:tRNA-specific 2-thiouridylase